MNLIFEDVVYQRLENRKPCIYGLAVIFIRADTKKLLNPNVEALVYFSGSHRVIFIGCSL
jgi:hypothetical protein